MRRLYITRSHVRECGATGMSRVQGDRSRQINASQQRMQNEDKGEMEQSEEGREGLEAEEQRQDRHLEKAVMRSVSSDPDPSRAEDEHTRRLVEIENDDGPRGSDAEKTREERESG